MLTNGMDSAPVGTGSRGLFGGVVSVFVLHNFQFDKHCNFVSRFHVPTTN